nr:metal-sensing transcriptional repressor [Maliibacterium massiliense]
MKADNGSVLRLLRTARGQMDGIIRMVEEDRYCVDISNQILATQSILQKVNREIIRAHLKGCVRDAFASGEADAKIEEMIALLDKMAK